MNNSVEQEGALRNSNSEMRLAYSSENFRSKKRYINVKKERTSLRFDPYLPFQNAKVTGDYYIVPS